MNELHSQILARRSLVVKKGVFSFTIQIRERGYNYVLVLPPWGGLRHWRTPAYRIKWGELFYLKSLSQFVPVMEFEDFLAINGHKIDLVLYLQPYMEGWSESEGFTLKYDVRPCIEAQHYYGQNSESTWEGFFFSYGSEMKASLLECLSIQGQSSTLADAIIKYFHEPMSLMVDRAETILHDRFGDVFYWNARRSMRYAPELRKIGDQFRYLISFNSL
ncbi:GDP-fucose protein o-fucosyltransferase domain-containing protein [Ditylenchus destructor]|uniref:GDP-fucose protein O-fucosyltransferase 2 n=1 Tax=Ditylenchus destructor TaxID=166010 RepID=A0AAD4R867_9BILA|nr:GDP-fucose protein o-fucosyltransferase domain-containing protein [Ditylenchus destructor]